MSSSNLPPNWETSVDPSTGRTFYVNHVTQQTSWSLPVLDAFPPGWDQRKDEQGRTYFVNLETGQSTWDDPRLTMDAGGDSGPVSYPSDNLVLQSIPPEQQQQKQRFQLRDPNASNSSSNANNCPSCTFANAASAVKCVICDTPLSLKSSSLESDEQLAKRLQAEMDAQISSSNVSSNNDTTFESSADSPTIKRPGFVVTEPFELAPFMVPDSVSKVCTKCGNDFTMLKRRHHCKCCGMLACGECTSKKVTVRLPGQAEELNSKDQRVCDWCCEHIEEGHAHCLQRYVNIATDQEENKDMALRGLCEEIENLPQMLSSEVDKQLAMKEIRVINSIGGVSRLCSFLSPGEPPLTQSLACRLIASLAAVSCVREFESEFPRRQVASDICQGAALQIMATILAKSSSTKDVLASQISTCRVMYLLGDLSEMRTAARQEGIIVPLSEALLTTDAQLQDWSCMALGKMLKGDRPTVQAFTEANGIQSLVLLLSSGNAMIQEHAALALNEALQTDVVTVKKALSGLSSTSAAISLINSRETHVVTAGLRLLAILSEREGDAASSGVPALVGIVASQSRPDPEQQTLALQVLRAVAGVGATNRSMISQSGGLAAAMSLMKNVSTDISTRREAAGLVEQLSADPDGARGVLYSSGGLTGLVDAAKTDFSSSHASNALASILQQGPEAQAALLEAGALDALLQAGARGDPTMAARVIEATFNLTSDASVLPRLCAAISPPVLATRLINLAIPGGLQAFTLERLVLTLALLCGARPSDHEPAEAEFDDAVPIVVAATLPQTRQIVSANGASVICPLLSHPSPGVVLAALRCLLVVCSDGGDSRIVASKGVEQCVAAIEYALKQGGGDDARRVVQMQTLLYSTALFGKLAGGSHARKHALDQSIVKRGIRLIGDCLSCDEPDVMLAAVRALKELSLQSGNWAAVAELALPRLLEILLADKTGHGPNGRAPLSGTFILKLLMDVSAITANLATLEQNSNLVLDAGGVFALVGLLQEPEDKAAVAGITALTALVDSSKRCANGLAKVEGAFDTLLGLAEQRQEPLSVQCLQLVLKVVSLDASNAAALGQSVLSLDTLLKLVRFEQSELALQILLCVATSSDALWKRLVSTRDVSSALALLTGHHGNTSSSLRVQAGACVALQHLIETYPEVASNAEVLNCFGLISQLLQSKDQVGGDKSESPSLEACGVVCALSKTDNAEVKQHLLQPPYELLARLGGLLLRERRFSRPRSATCSFVLDSLVHLLDSPSSFWSLPMYKSSDLLSALTLVIEAYTRETGPSPNNSREAVAVADDVVWLLCGVDQDQPYQSQELQRLVRPLISQLEHCDTSERRSHCAKFMLKLATKELNLAVSFVHSGGLKVAMGACSKEEVPETIGNIGLLLGQLLVSCPERAHQDAMASSHCLKILVDAMSKSSTVEISRALADLALGGGKPVRTAIFHTNGILEAMEGKPSALLIVARLAAVDEFREQLIGHLTTCQQALEEQNGNVDNVRAAVDLLAHLSTVTQLSEELVLLAKNSVVLNDTLPIETRSLALEVLWSAANFNESAKCLHEDVNDWLSPLMVGSPNNALQKSAVLLLERLCAAMQVRPSENLLTSLVTVLKAPSVETERSVLAALESMCAVSFPTRKMVRELQGGVLLKAARKAGANRLLKILGEDVLASGTTNGKLGGEKRLQQDSIGLIPISVDSSSSGKLLPQQQQPISTPPPPNRSLPTFTSSEVSPRSQSHSSNPFGGPPAGPPPPPLPPPPSQQQPLTSPHLQQHQGWACPACTFLNSNSSNKCEICDAVKPPQRLGAAKNTQSAISSARSPGETVVVNCKGCGIQLRGPATSPTLSCPKCFEITATHTGVVRVRCAQCMGELLAPDTSKNFRCSKCGAIGETRDRKMA